MAFLRGIKFDPTFNFGHVFTLITLVWLGLMAFDAHDKRILVLEENRKQLEAIQQLRDQNQDVIINSNNQHILETLSDIKSSLDKLDQKLEQRKGNEHAQY